MSFVFVSHAAPDKQKRVRPLVQALAILEVPLWIDRPGSGGDDFQLPREFVSRHQIQSLRLGQDWDDQIKSALRDADAVLICLSKSALEAEREVLRQEMWGAQLIRKAVTCIVDDLDLSAMPQEHGLLSLGKSQSLRIDTETLELAVDWLSKDASRTPDQLPKAYQLVWQSVCHLRDELQNVRVEARSASQSPSSDGALWPAEEFPNYIQYFEAECSELVGYSAAGYVGRNWLVKSLVDSLAALGDRGGIVILQAPSGWGKTAAALSWVRASLDPSAATPLLIDGWAFAKQTGGPGQGSGASRPSGNLDVVLKQLESHTRRRLGMRRSRTNGGDFPGFLWDCHHIAQARGRPVILLIDAVDEAIGANNADLAERLTDDWPKGVQLVVTGRASAVGEHRFTGTPRRPVIRLDTPKSRTQADIAAFVAARIKEIRLEQDFVVEEALNAAILDACKQSFVMASGLLRRREGLRDELEQWQSGATTLPKDLQEYWDQEIGRAVRRIRARGLFASGGPDSEFAVRQVVIQLLGWLIIGEREWKSVSFARWFQFACTASLTGQNDGVTAIGLGQLQALAADAKAVQSLLECMADLFGSPYVSDDSVLDFVHLGLRQHTAAKSNAITPNLHALWAALCESAVLANDRSDEERWKYAFFNAPRHLALASAIDPGAWFRGANMVLDLRTDSDGYLNLLFSDHTLAPGAWDSVCRGIATLLSTAPASQRADSSRLGLLDQLLSVRHVLSDKHALISAGRLPLAAVLFNGQAGHWKAGGGTLKPSWGNRLEECADALAVPWLRDTSPSGAAAFGPLTHPLPARITVLAASDDCRWLAIGLENGSTRIWSRTDLTSGHPGATANQHDGAVLCLAIVSRPDLGEVWLASGGHDGVVCVIRMAAAGTLKTEPGEEERAKGRIVLRLASAVTCMAMIAGVDDCSWVLAAGAAHGDVYMVKGSRSAFAATPSLAAPGGLCVLSHSGSVADLALIADGKRGDWWLASASFDGTTQVVNGAVRNLPGADGHLPNAGEEPGGEGPHLHMNSVLATRHEGPATKVALLSTDSQGQWVLASGGADGIVRVVTRADMAHSRGAASTSRETLVSRHSKPIADLALRPAAAPALWRLASAGDDGVVIVATDQDVSARSVEVDQASTGGFVVSRHEGECYRLALLSNRDREHWIVASTGALDGTVRVAGPKGSAAGSKSLASRLRPSREIVAVRHRTHCVTGVAFLPDDGGILWLVSADVEGSLCVTELCEHRIAPAASPEALFGRRMTRHSERITSLALLALEDDNWILASGSEDGSTRVSAGARSTSSVFPNEGQIATFHGEGGYCQVSRLVLAEGLTPGDWWLASGAVDGSVRIARRAWVEEDSAAGVEQLSGPRGQLLGPSGHCHESIVTGLDLHAGQMEDECLAAWTDATGAVRVAGTLASSRRGVVAAHPSDATSVRIILDPARSPAFVASASWHGIVAVSDIRGSDERLATTIEIEHDAAITALAVLPVRDGGMWPIVAGDERGEATLWCVYPDRSEAEPDSIELIDKTLASDLGTVIDIIAQHDAPESPLLIHSASALSMLVVAQGSWELACLLATPSGMNTRVLFSNSSVVIGTTSGRDSFAKCYRLCPGRTAPLPNSGGHKKL